MIKHENNYCFNSCIDIERTTFNVYHHDTRGQSLYCLYHPDDEKLVARIRVIPKVKVYVIVGDCSDNASKGRFNAKTYLSFRGGIKYSRDENTNNLNTIDDAERFEFRDRAEELTLVENARLYSHGGWVRNLRVEEVWVKP